MDQTQLDIQKLIKLALEQGLDVEEIKRTCGSNKLSLTDEEYDEEEEEEGGVLIGLPPITEEDKRRVDSLLATWERDNQ